MSIHLQGHKLQNHTIIYIHTYRTKNNDKSVWLWWFAVWTELSGDTVMWYTIQLEFCKYDGQIGQMIYKYVT